MEGSHEEAARVPAAEPVGEILILGIGLAMFYGLKRFREWPLGPR